MEIQRERKLKHCLEKGAIYFITSVTKDRKPIFLGNITARFFTITIAYHKFALNFLLFGYVVMPEHFHLLLQPFEKIPLSKIMNYIKGNFSRKYNEFFNPKIEEHSHLPVWQKEYYDSVIRNEKDFIEKLNYIHYNPVKRALVKSPNEYEFSSYHQYFGEEREKIQIPIDKILL